MATAELDADEQRELERIEERRHGIMKNALHGLWFC
jgi:hypothetical protein